MLSLRFMIQLLVFVGMLAAGEFAGPSDLAGQEKKPAVSPAEAVNLFTDAANFQNEGAFALAVEEWEKFLKKFPQDPLAEKARHYAGVCHLQLKQLDKAAELFSRVLADNPDFERAEDAYLNLGWCQFSLAGKENTDLLAKSATTLTTYLKKFPQGKYADQARYFLAESQYLRGQKQEAIATYSDMVAKYPESSLRASALYALGVAHEELKHYQEAGSVYDQYLQENPTSDLAPEVRMRKGETLLQGGNAAAAEKIFAEVAALANYASADYALYRQAYCAVEQERLSDAGALYAKLATRYPTSSYARDAAISAGRSFYLAQKQEEAVRWFLKAVADGGPTATEAAHWLCQSYLKLNEPQRVVELADKVLVNAAGHPYEVALLLDQADALYRLNEWREDAVQRYSAIAAKHPQHTLAPQALYNAAFGNLELKQFDGAIKQAAEFASRYPQHALIPDVRFVAAECQLLARQFEPAEKTYRQLIDEFPQHAEAGSWRVRLGVAINLQKKYAETIEYLNANLATLKRPEQIAEAQYLIGVSRYQQKQFPEALAALEASVAASPSWRQADETLLFLAAAQRSADQLDAARSTLARMPQLFPHSKLLDQTYYRSGEYAYAAEDFPAAIAAYDEMLKRYPESSFVPFALHNKGWAQLKNQQYPIAAESFTQMLDKFQEHSLAAEAHLARGMCERLTGQLVEAVADFDAFLATNPPQPGRSDALYERGLTEVKLKQFDKAAATFRSVLAENKSYPQAAKVLYELAWANKEAGKSEEAVAAFTELTRQYPEDDLAAEAFFHVAEAAYEKQQYAEALQSYSEARQRGQGEIAEKATYKRGWSQFKLGKYDQAQQDFLDQQANFPQGTLAADAKFMIAECLFKQSKFDEALPAFRTAIETPASSTTVQTLAYLHGGQTAGQLQQWQQSLEWLDQIPRKFPESDYLAEALYERGWAKQNLKQVDAALADYEEAASRSRAEVGARARFMIGEIQFERQQHDEAIKSFLRVMYGFGGDKALDEVKKWQANAGWEAGRCAEVQLKNAKSGPDHTRLLQDAKTYYLYVSERHPRHQLAAQAKERLTALSKLR